MASSIFRVVHSSLLTRRFSLSVPMGSQSPLPLPSPTPSAPSNLSCFLSLRICPIWTFIPKESHHRCLFWHYMTTSFTSISGVEIHPCCGMYQYFTPFYKIYFLLIASLIIIPYLFYLLSYHKIHPLQVCHSVVFCVFTRLCSCHHCLIPDHFHFPRKKPHAL